MRLAIRHRTTYAYEPPASRAALRLRLFPGDTAQQSVQDWAVTVNEDLVVPLLTDAAGDQSGQWFSHRPVERIVVEAAGTVETTDRSGVLGNLGSAPPAVYLRRTPQTRPDGAIRALAEQVTGDNPLARMHNLSEAVAKAIAYRKGLTDSTTTAAEAMALGGGVCQDLTHVLISAARVLDVPARYVVGYFLAADSGAEPHAWAELRIEGLGWVAFDPTHQLCPADAHVRLSAGLDAQDAAPIRGNVSGEHSETLEVSVEIRNQAQSQSQS